MKIEFQYFIKMVVIFTTIFFIPTKLISNDIYTNQSGIWVVRHNLNTRASVDKLVDNLKTMNFTDVYLQIRGRGYTYYDSRLEPKSPKITDDFDPLEYAIEQLKPLNINIHAWFNAYLLWTSPKNPISSEHLYYKHPEWLEKSYIKNRKKDVQNIWLLPHLDDVNQYLTEMINELVDNYSLDGIHLDYIRFDNEYHGVHSDGIKEFQSIFLADKSTLKDNELWIDYKSEKINLFVEALHYSLKKKNIALSAAVKPNFKQAYTKYSQDWYLWLTEDLVDYVVLMNYSTNTRIFTQNLNLIQKKSVKEKVHVGIGLWNKKDKTNSEQITQAKKLGFENIVMFSYDTIIDKYKK